MTLEVGDEVFIEKLGFGRMTATNFYYKEESFYYYSLVPSVDSSLTIELENYNR